MQDKSRETDEIKLKFTNLYDLFRIIIAFVKRGHGIGRPECFCKLNGINMMNEKREFK